MHDRITVSQFQVMSSLREDEDAVVKLRVASDSVTSFHAVFSSARMKVMSGSSQSDSMKDTGQKALNFHKSLSVPFGPELADYAYDGKNELSSDRKEGILLGELTASCLATLILIQVVITLKLNEILYLFSEVWTLSL